MSVRHASSGRVSSQQLVAVVQITFATSFIHFCSTHWVPIGCWAGMCCQEERHKSDMVPRETQPGRRAKGYGEGPDLYQEEVFMKEVVMAQPFDE